VGGLFCIGGYMLNNEVDAVNVCLAGIGLEPVTESEIDSDLDAGTALTKVRLVTERILSKGLWFNKEYHWNLTPDTVTGYINVPSGAISVIPSGESYYRDLSLRQNKMYDMVNHTYDLRDLVNSDGAIEFMIIMRLTFEDIPFTARNYITYIARREWAQDSEVDERRWRFQKSDEMDANISMLREDARGKKRNSITDNGVIQSFLARVGGPNSHSSQVGIYPKRNE